MGIMEITRNNESKGKALATVGLAPTIKVQLPSQQPLIGKNNKVQSRRRGERGAPFCVRVCSFLGKKIVESNADSQLQNLIRAFLFCYFRTVCLCAFSPPIRILDRRTGIIQTAHSALWRSACFIIFPVNKKSRWKPGSASSACPKRSACFPARITGPLPLYPAWASPR